MDLFDLVVKLSIDDDNFDKGLADVKNKISSMKGVIAGVGAATAAIVGTVAAVKAVGDAVVQGTAELAQYGDEIDKTSQKLGLSTEAYQEWDAVLKHSGTSIDSLKAGMRTLSNAAESGNEAFQKLGFTQEQVASMSNEELFSNTITALQNVSDETERARLASELLGRGAIELGALLNTSAEETQAMKDRVHELGGVMSDEVVKASAKFKDNLQDMNTAIDGVKRSIQAEFLPALNLLMEGFTSLIANEEGAEEKLVEGFEKLVDGFEGAVKKLEPIAKTLIPRIVEFAVKSLPDIANLSIDIVDTLVDTILDNVDELLTAATQIIYSLSDGLSKMLPELIPAVTSIVFEIVNTLLDNQDQLIEAAEQIITALADGLSKAIPILIEKAPEIIIKLATAIINNLGKLIEIPAKIIKTIADGLVHHDWTETAEAMMDGLIKALDTAQKKVQVWMDNAFSGGKLYGGDIANVDTTDFVKNLESGKDTVVNAIGDFTGAVQESYDTFYGVADENNKKVIGYTEESLGKMADAQAQSAKNAGRTTQDAVNDILNKRNQTTKTIENSTKDTVKAVQQSQEDIDAKLRQSISKRFLMLENTMLEKGFTKEWLVKQERAYIEALNLNTDLYAEYNNKLLKAEKEISDSMEKERQSQIAETNKRLGTMLDGMAKAAKQKVDEYKKVLEDLRNQIRSFGDSLISSYTDMFKFDVDEETGKVTATKTRDYIKNATAELNEYYDNIQKLRDMNISESMLNQLTGMSASEGKAVTDYWLSLSEGQLNTLNTRWNEYEAAGQRVSETLYSDELQAQGVELDETRNTILGDIKETVTSVGSDMIQAFRETTQKETIININGIQYQNLSELTSAISTQLGFNASRRSAGYAV
jgi:hypothetical protein